MRHWEAIEAFVEVVQQGSFSAAAKKLKVSPSHISRLVSRLEAELSTPLMYRTTRKFRLSEAGSITSSTAVICCRGLSLQRKSWPVFRRNLRVL